MATIDDNPAGIQFDDAGPGAGTTVPKHMQPKTSADKIAAVAAKAKKTPATKPVVKSALGRATLIAAPEKKVAAATGNTKAKSYRYDVLVAERYKLATDVNAAVARTGGRVVGFALDTASTNSYAILIEIEN